MWRKMTLRWAFLLLGYLFAISSPKPWIYYRLTDPGSGQITQPFLWSWVYPWTWLRGSDHDSFQASNTVDGVKILLMLSLVYSLKPEQGSVCSNVAIVCSIFNGVSVVEVDGIKLDMNPLERSWRFGNNSLFPLLTRTKSSSAVGSLSLWYFSKARHLMSTPTWISGSRRRSFSSRVLILASISFNVG